MKFSFYGFHYPCLSLHFCMSRLVFRGNPLTEERERYTIKNRRSSQSPCRVPLIIHVDSKTRRQEGFELRASKKHFFFFFFRATKIPYADKSWLFDRGFPARGSIFYLQSHTLDHTRTLFHPRLRGYYIFKWFGYGFGWHIFTTRGVSSLVIVFD